MPPSGTVINSRTGHDAPLAHDETHARPSRTEGRRVLIVPPHRRDTRPALRLARLRPTVPPGQPRRAVARRAHRPLRRLNPNRQIYVRRLRLPADEPPTPGEARRLGAVRHEIAAMRPPGSR